jgi:nucleotide-binding universal stress UspA family protein
MITEILVPLDTSAVAEQALPYAIVLARRAQGKLRLTCFASSVSPEMVNVAEADAYLSKIAAALEPELPGRITYGVLSNEPGPLQNLLPVASDVAYHISHQARERDADVIVMTERGLGGARRTWLGSVADALIRIASRPVLFIEPREDTAATAHMADHGVQHILIPLDGSTAAEEVIPHALELGSLFGARYSLLRVLSPLPIEELPSPLPALNRPAAEEYLAHVAADIGKQGASTSTHIVESLLPGPEIVDFAETHAVDVIAITTEGAGGVRRLLLGSVAETVIRASDTPVLVCNIHGIADDDEADRADAADTSF